MVDLNATAGTLIGFDEYIAIIPCLVLGFLIGLANYFKPLLENHNFRGSWHRMFASMLSSSVLSFIIFAILDSTDLTFMTKLAISCAVAFLGIDKAVDLIERLLNLHKRGNS